MFSTTDFMTRVEVSRWTPGRVASRSSYGCWNAGRAPVQVVRQQRRLLRPLARGGQTENKGKPVTVVPDGPAAVNPTIDKIAVSLDKWNRITVTVGSHVRAGIQCGMSGCETCG